MYEERKKRFNWISFLLKFILIILVVILVIKLLPFDQNNSDSSKVFNNNLSKLREVGNNYFNEDNVPDDDEEKIVTLKTLIDEKKIDTLKDKDGKTCDTEKSYLKVFKISAGYELEVNLECGKEKDSTFSYLGCFNKCDNKTTTTTTTKATTTKKTTTKNDNVTTTKKTTTTTTTTTTTKIKGYSVIFNVAGGTNVNNQYIVKGNYAKAPVNPTKEGYKFDGWYLNNDLYDFNTPVNSNIILIAKWVPNN
jgi:uncharacterized repeat protein (TIGR02543 family)